MNVVPCLCTARRVDSNWLFGADCECGQFACFWLDYDPNWDSIDQVWVTWSVTLYTSWVLLRSGGVIVSE